MSEDVHGLVGAYALDALDEVERIAFERHLTRCPECQAEVSSLREATVSLSLISAARPPETLRTEVLAGIRSVRPPPPLDMGHEQSPAEPVAPVVPLAAHRRIRPWGVAAAAAAAILVGGVIWSPWDDPSRNPTATERVLRAADAERYDQSIDGGRAVIVRSEALGQAVLITDDMPDAPDGKDFQLWLNIPGEGLVSAGLVPQTTRPTTTVMLDGDAAEATGAGITLEPAGGSISPTTDPVAFFEFS